MNRTSYEMVKRVVDVIGASVGLIVFLPVLALCAGLILLLDGPGVIHRRKVVGKNGVIFTAFKLRTMTNEADKVLHINKDLKREFERNFKLKEDPRVTRIGKFLRKWSIDEIPQFINVLKGEMSLVGPRMCVPEELCKYGEFAKIRVMVKPGITGYWQVNGRQNTTFEERIEMDKYYVENASLLLDAKILVKTLPAVVSTNGAV
ncbi:MAG: sugar transferase [Tepidanaerobacteraceae bacterium]|nr:sugar transferase [Tepidanaerobacteraceae bacterium]